ncbi:reverse transcriptase domain, reverse transcriptase zinc-binding domain protein [Tanacetum coccineum]
MVPRNSNWFARGVRQGGPYCRPFLFILAAEGLNSMIKEAVQKDIFNGIKVGAERVVVSHMQYADDTIFFGEWDKENAKKIMCILKCFERVSGLKVNLNKSILYGVGDFQSGIVCVGKVHGEMWLRNSKKDYPNGKQKRCPLRDD